MTISRLNVSLPGLTGYFTPKLLEAFNDQGLYGTGKEQRYDWLGRLGEELATGEKGVLGFIANVNGNHWVTVMVDAITGVIWHGDPMGGGRGMC